MNKKGIAVKNIDNVLGVLLLLTPLIFGIVTFGSHLWSAWVIGSIVSVVAVALAFLWLLKLSYAGVRFGMTVMIGTVVFVLPWVLNEVSMTVSAVLAASLGLFLLLLTSGRMLISLPQRQAGFAMVRPLRRIEAH